MRTILAIATGTGLVAQLEDAYILDAVTVIPTYEDGLKHLDQPSYQADILLIGDRSSPPALLQPLLDRAATIIEEANKAAGQPTTQAQQTTGTPTTPKRSSVIAIFLYREGNAGLRMPQGVSSMPATTPAQEIAVTLGLIHRPLQGSQVWLFFTLKGGVGKTTCTIMTAIALTHIYPDQKVCIWDLDLPKGNIGLAFGRPRDALTIRQLLHEPRISEISLLRRYLYTDRRTGIDMLLAPADSTDPPVLDVTHFFAILGSLQAMYPFVLLDFEPELQRNLHLVHALTAATEIILVTDNSAFSRDAVRRFIPIAQAERVQHKLHLILNNIYESLPPEELATITLPLLGVIERNQAYEAAFREQQPPTGKKLVDPFLATTRKLLNI